MLRITALMASLACLTPTGHAQRESHSAFWREVRNPGFLRSRELLHQGRSLAALAVHAQGPEQRGRLLASIRRFRRAQALAPGDPEALFELARGLTALAEQSSREMAADSGGPTMSEARTLYARLRREHPRYEAQRVAFELGVLAARAHDFQAAAAEYQRALDEVEVGEGAPSMHANLAEVRMLAGELAEAEGEYRRAVELGAGRPTRGLALSLFGLAVCLDRQGDPEEAMRVTRRALGISGATVLRADGVFFEPSAEIHYYEALALRTQAADARDANARRQLLRQAAASLRRYLSATPRDAEFYELGSRRLESVRNELRAHMRRHTARGHLASGRVRPRR